MSSFGNATEFPPKDPIFEDAQRTIYIVVGVIGGLIVLSMIGICICIFIPLCYLSSQSRDRRRNLQGGVIAPPAYGGQPGGYGQFGGQPGYNTGYPSQQQFNSQSPSNMGNPSNPSAPAPAAASGVLPLYPVQQSQSGI